MLLRAPTHVGAAANVVALARPHLSARDLRRMLRRHGTPRTHHSALLARQTVTTARAGRCAPAPRSERAPRSLYSSRSRRRWIPTRTLNGEHTCLIVTKVAMHTACIQSDRIYQMIQHPLITHERAPHLERHASRRGRASWDKASNCSSRRSRPCCRGLSQLRPSQLRSTICLSPCRLRPPILRPSRPNHLRPSHHLVGRALLEPSKPPALPPPDMYRISEVHEAAVAVCAGRHTARRS